MQAGQREREREKRVQWLASRQVQDLRLLWPSLPRPHRCPLLGSQFCDEHGNRGNVAASLPVISVCKVGAKICGADLGAMYYGAEVPAT